VAVVTAGPYIQIICTSRQTVNHNSTSPLSFLQAGCPSCRPTNSVKALKAVTVITRCHVIMLLNAQAVHGMEMVSVIPLRTPTSSSSNLNALAAISKSMRTVKLCSNKFLQFLTDKHKGCHSPQRSVGGVLTSLW